MVFFIDECHLLGGNVCGYAWGKKKERIEVPIKNIKDRQTYYGALDYQTKEFIVREYPKGESEQTIDFIKYLRSQRPRKRIALIWDGARYHKSAKIKDFLSSVNDNREPENWLIHCIVFDPNAPEQNPVEDVWLQAKNFLRKFWHLGKSFAVTKWLFKFFTQHQTFDFPKLLKYAPSS